MSESLERLNKHLALQLGVSRREADDLIANQQVRVDGTLAEIGRRVSLDSSITVDGKTIVTNTAFTYLMFNKPVGYVCSRRSQDENPTIYELLPKEYHMLKPVGRLDKDSSGILILTNDGDFAFEMTHPKFQKVKIYEAKLDRELAPLHQQMIGDFGVALPDGTSKFGLERLDAQRTEWRITMHEGRNRQIRRTFGSLGYTITALHRIVFGTYTLGDLREGMFAETTRA